MDVPDEDSLERAPRLEHYRNSLNLPIPRPTLTDLHDACPEELNDEEKKVFDEEFGFDFPIEERGKTPVPEASEVEEVEERGLGWFRGVFVPCVLNILGLMIYIRVGWVAGHAGIVMGTALILLSTAICVVTALSLSAICTNGDARGGPYFLISRSLGPEFGGSIGVIFAVANAMGAAMYATGFSETVQELLSRNGHEIADGGVNDVRIISAITLLLLFLLIQSGFKLNSWGQILLLTILFVSMGSFFIGALLPSSILAKERGITGVSSETFVDNLGPLWKTGSGMTVFAVFFPAATGIMAGTHSAEELEHPQSAIPRGTLAAIGTTAFAYILTLWMTGATVRRNLSLDASGNYTHIDLLHYYPVVQAESIWPPIVVVGTLAASLSSTLASIVYASRVLQVLSRDKLFPGIHHFATGWRNHVQPQKAQLFITGIAILVSLVGILNSIASVISNFFLAFYALVNYACFNASFADSPGFRPCFKYYNLWVSLCGAMVCVVIMFLINWISAMITWAVLFALYSYIHRRNTGLNWGSSAQASIYRSALQSVLKLAHTEDHVKNYRPQILVLTGNPVSRPSLVDYMSNITRDNSLLICGHILVASSPVRFHAYLPALTKRVESWLWSRKVKAFYCPVAAASFEDGATQLIQLAGIGKLRPNILFLGFKHDWQRSTFAEIDAFINVIHHAFDQNFGVGLVRLPDGLHLSGQITLLDRNASERRSQRSQRTPTPTDEPTEPKRRLREHYKDQDLEPESLMNDMETAKMELQASINQFQLKTRGTIDVWWLYDDGALSLEMQSCFMEPASLALGLSLLLPHLLAGKGSYLDGSRMRVFTIASSQRQLEQEQRRLNDYKALVSGIKKSGTDAEDSCFTNAHLSAQRERTFRHLRVRELLLEHSMEADMIFIVLSSLSSTMKVDETKPFLFPAPPKEEASIAPLKEPVQKENGQVPRGIVFSNSDVHLVLDESDGSTQESPELDPWQLPEISLDEGPKWKDMNGWERFRMVGFGAGKVLGLFGLLYLFICSLGLLSDSFRLLGGRAAGEIFRDSQMLHNPICGLMLGILATVLLQSSSTSTSIVVSMVASDILTVRMAIPIIMGANIGTSLTNTLVSVAHSSKRAEFRRAFAGATVHDMFNWLCVIILLPLEVASGYLYRVSGFIIHKLALDQQNQGAKPPKLLKVLTDPLTKRIIQLDKSKIKAIALGKLNDDAEDDFTLIKRWCGKMSPNMTINGTEIDEALMGPKCNHLFASVAMKDSYIGMILLAASLAALICCLVFIVKILNSLLKGKIASVIRKTINNDFPGCFSFLTGYAAILLGAVMTILVQSSSVFTSTLTPLVGIGILSLDRMYPLTLGSNVGTTFTSVLAAMASPPENLGPALQIALCHLLFNITGIILFYPIPITRKAPIALAKMLGNKTAKYRWVAVLYVAVMFFLLPGTIFGLSMAGPGVLMGVGGPFLIIFFGITLVNVLQSQCPKCLPRFLRSWRFLPDWMHSFKPLDTLLGQIGDGIQRICPFCSSGWSLCFQSPDTGAQAPMAARNHESRKNLLLATSPANSAYPSRAPTRSNSPNRGRMNRNDSRTPL